VSTLQFPPANIVPVAPGAATSRILVKPRHGWQPIDFAELWHFRELLWILAMRDVKVRYKQTALGVLWAIIQPMASMLVFTIIFAKLGKLPTDGMQPELFYFSGLLPWMLFSNSLSQAGNSMITNQNLISKVYFPRLIIPMAGVLTGVIDFAISFGVLMLLMLYYRTMPSIYILLVPVFVVLACLASLAVGLWLAALNVEYRDVRYIIPFLTQFWLYITPVPYPASMVPAGWKRWLFGLNPISGVVEGFRWCMFGAPAPGPMLAVSIATILVVLFGGLFYFRRVEKTFADRI
jgi:lipopolysaccharide transport system permease protein